MTSQLSGIIQKILKSDKNDSQIVFGVLNHGLLHHIVNTVIQAVMQGVLCPQEAMIAVLFALLDRLPDHVVDLVVGEGIEDAITGEDYEIKVWVVGVDCDLGFGGDDPWETS